MKFIGQIKNNNYLIYLTETSNFGYNIIIDSKKYQVTCLILNKKYCVLSIDNKIVRIVYFMTDNRESKVDILINNRMASVNIEEENLFSLKSMLQKNKQHNKDIIFHIYSPMPGIINKIHKKPNDDVNKNNILLIIEAMKMENEIKAIVEGKIKDVFVKEKQPVQKNTLLMSVILK